MTNALDLQSRVDLSQPPLLNAPLASPELASAIVGSLADAVLVYDAAGGVVAGNPTATTLLGLAPPASRETVTRPLVERGSAFDLLTLEGKPLPREAWPAVRVLRGETLSGARTVDLIARGADGRERILNISGAPLLDDQGEVVGAVCVCRDITERKQLEQELARRAAELESIFTTQVEAVVFVDTSGRIVRMNEAQRRLLASRGIDPASEQIDTWAAQTAPRDAQGQPVPRERLPFYRALRGETVIGDDAVEMYQRTQDGQDLVIRVSGAPVRDAQGEILGVVLTTYDVTQQRRLEQQRLAIMRVVAHDLANPVAVMRLYLQMQQRRMRRGEPPMTPDDQLLSQMDYALTRMQRLLDDLRVATQVEVGTLGLQRVRHDVAAICREEAAAMQAVSRREVRVEIPEEPLWADVDSERIGQVVANLLSNALKYSPADRAVTLTVRCEQGLARVDVRDRGPGLSAHEQQRLFGQFQRVEGIEAQDGTGGLGLGLYISKGIVERHGGQIGVTSTVGEGSSFWFKLPLAEPQQTPTTAQ